MKKTVQKKSAPKKCAKAGKKPESKKAIPNVAGNTDKLIADFKKSMDGLDESMKIVPNAKKEIKLIVQQLEKSRQLAAVLDGRALELHDGLNAAVKDYNDSIDRCGALYKELKKAYAQIVKFGKKFKASGDAATGKLLKEAVQQYTTLDKEFDVQSKKNEKAGKDFNKKAPQFINLIKKNAVKYGVSPDVAKMCHHGEECNCASKKDPAKKCSCKKTGSKKCTCKKGKKASK